MRFAVDELNTDRVTGWAFDGRREPEVVVVVNGREVGRASTGAYRSDVARALEDERAARCGFEFRFEPQHFQHVTARDAEVVIQFGKTRMPPVNVPVLGARAEATTTSRGPLPPAILGLLAAYRGEYASPVWGDDLTARAVADLKFLLERGPRAVPELHHHLLYLGELWVHAASVERYFPRENREAGIEAKDRSALQSSATEIFCIAAHLATLRAHGVPGVFAEFGCFKGFSTAILSHACHHLGLEMHVFDSFSGLPPSRSAYYKQGEFAGSRAEVEANVSAYGNPAPVRYHAGYFADTLPEFAEMLICCLWIDVDLESSSRDVMTVFPRLDGRGVVFSHEAPAPLFGTDGLDLERSPEAVIPPIVDAFAEADRPIAARHLDGYTGAFWDSSIGIAPLATTALLDLRDLALSL
jgi:hypothetical protein